MNFSNVLLFVTLLILNCAYYRTGKTDCLYVSDMAKNPDSFIETTFSYGEIDTNRNKNDLRTIKILIDHDNWGEKYFARQQVPDEVFRMRYKDRAEYYKKYDMYSLGRWNGSGYQDIKKIDILEDSLPILIKSVSYDKHGWGGKIMSLKVHDTCVAHLRVITESDTLYSLLYISKSVVKSEPVCKRISKTRRVPYINPEGYFYVLLEKIRRKLGKGEY
jgi:hypothetical protein